MASVTFDDAASRVHPPSRGERARLAGRAGEVPPSSPATGLRLPG